MTRENAKALLPIIEAYANGKEIEYLNIHNDWCDANECDFSSTPERYRIKLKPKIVPFTLEHGHLLIGKAIKGPVNKIVYLISKVDGFGIYIILDTDSNRHITFEDLLKHYTFIDGSPCGVSW